MLPSSGLHDVTTSLSLRNTCSLSAQRPAAESGLFRVLTSSSKPEGFWLCQRNKLRIASCQTQIISSGLKRRSLLDWSFMSLLCERSLLCSRQGGSRAVSSAETWRQGVPLEPYSLQDPSCEPVQFTCVWTAVRGIIITCGQMF